MGVYQPICELNEREKYIKVAIPLAKPSGKIRVKTRSKISANGLAVATREKEMTAECYIEWQIGYDVKVTDTEKVTTLKDKTFIGSNKAKKYLFELSEVVKYFYDWDLISEKELNEIKHYLFSVPNEELLDVNKRFLVKRTCPVETDVNGIPFLYSIVETPLLIYDFKNYKVLTEVQTKEKQYAVGTQPMLYFCFDLSELDNGSDYYNRTAKKGENATFTFNKENKGILLELLKIFGTLSLSHKNDVISIIDLILSW